MINTFKIKLFYLTMSGLLGIPLQVRLANHKSSLKDFNNEFSTENTVVPPHTLKILKQADSYEPAV